MQASKLLATFRQQAADDVGPVFVIADEAFYGFLSEAESEACVRARLLRDSTTEQVCRIDLEVGVGTYRLDPRIDLIELVRLQWPDADSTRRTEIPHLGIEELPIERERTGRPRAVFREGNTLILDRLPTDPGVIHLDVYRLPLWPITRGSDEPEIREEFHLALLDWVKYRAYNTKDSQALDEARAAAAYQRYEAQFGPKPTAWSQRHRQERRRVTTRPRPLGGY